MKIQISDNLIKHYLQNVYFINGHSYAGKSTMVRMLAERYDMIHCGENYHDVFPNEKLSRWKQPGLSYFETMSGWQEWLNMTPEEHWNWTDQVSKECVEIEILELIKRAASGKKVIVDTNIPPDVLREISSYDRVAILLCDPPDITATRFFDRDDPDKKFMMEQIKKCPDPETTLKNFNAWALYHPPVEIDWEHTGFFSYTRSDFDTDTREEMLSVLAKHFGLENKDWADKKTKQGSENMLNEQEKKVIAQYTGFPEGKRLSYTKAHETEFIVTMHYLHKFLSPGAKTADVGAGGGTYVKALADEGYSVDAVELTPQYVEEMKALFAGNENVNVYEGNAKNLPFLKDNEYDVVLLMGPIYSIEDFEDRKRACREALRIAKPGGVVFVAFCLQDGPLVHEIFMNENPAAEILTIGYDRENAIVTDNTGSSRILDTIAEVDKLTDAVCAENIASKVCRFSQDGISQIIREHVNSMDEASFKEWIQYLLATAERPEFMGFSDHVVQVLEKI